MPGDGRVAHIGQPHLVQARARAALRRLVGFHDREEAVEDHLPHVGGSQRRVDGATDDRPAPADDRDGLLRRRVRAEQRLFGLPARLGEQRVLCRVELRAAGQLRLDELRKRQVHVVAAEQQVFADGLADEAEFAPVLDGLDEAEVRRAAADVDDEAARAGVQAVQLGGRVRCQPAVERGLRLLEQDDVLQPRLARGLHRQRAGHVVERRGHGQHDGQFLQAVVGVVLRHDVIPALDEVAQVARRDLDGREALHVRRGAPGDERRAAIDPRVTQPRLRRGDEPARHLTAVVAAELADDVLPRGVPRQDRRAGRQVVFAGEIEERGQQGPVAHVAGRDELGHGERAQFDAAVGARRAGQVEVGQRAVRRAEVDPDQVTWHVSRTPEAVVPA